MGMWDRRRVIGALVLLSTWVVVYFTLVPPASSSSVDEPLCFFWTPGHAWVPDTDCSFWGGYSRVWCDQPANTQTCTDLELAEQLRTEPK